MGRGRKNHTGSNRPMELRARTRAGSSPRLSNYCAQCGEVLFMPEWSEYLNEHRVRHLWTCDACGYRFETVVALRES